jgi:hypothetical protein
VKTAVEMQHSQVDKVIEKEGCRCAQDSSPVPPYQKSPRDFTSFEVALLE